MAYNYSSSQMPCSKCTKYSAIESITQVPQKLFLSYSGDVESSGRKAITDIQIQAWQGLCCGCFKGTKLDEVKRIQEYDDIDIISVGTARYVEFCDMYSDICADQQWGTGSSDVYGEPTAYNDDKSGTFIDGQMRDYNVAGYFKVAEVEEQKKEVEERETAVEDEDDDIMLINKSTNNHFVAEEIQALKEFLDENKFDKVYSMTTFLEENKFIDFLAEKEMVTGRKVSGYARVYVNPFAFVDTQSV